MNTIVMNTATGAVTEYTGWAFRSLTPSYAGAANGLFALGGDDDAGVPIVGEVSTGERQWGTSLRKSLACMYFSIRAGLGCAVLGVGGPMGAHAYTFPLLPSGVSRCLVGKGIRENYLCFTLRCGLVFTLDSIEAEIFPSQSRRL